MSNRAERREAERLARKLAYQETRNKPAQTAQAAVPPPATTPAEPQISEAQLRANRANAQHSTGPVTSAGRAASSRNALKTALTGRTVLLPADDASEYNRRLENALALHSPVTEEEQALVQVLVDIDWRLDRIITLESGIYLKGTIEFADAHQDQPAAHRTALIQAETYLKYEKPLRNLNIQESRLQRQRAKTVAELKQLKADRARFETAPPAKAAAAAAANGFEFSIANESAQPASNPEPSHAAANAEFAPSQPEPHSSAPMRN